MNGTNSIIPRTPTASTKKATALNSGSRAWIIRPHSIGGEYAARVVWEKGRRRQVIPARFSGMGSAAYVGKEDENWIRDADVVELRDLLTAFHPDQLPDRVKRAIFYHEIAHQIQYVEIRWPHVVSRVLQQLRRSEFKGEAGTLYTCENLLAWSGHLTRCFREPHNVSVHQLWRDRHGTTTAT